MGTGGAMVTGGPVDGALHRAALRRAGGRRVAGVLAVVACLLAAVRLWPAGPPRWIPLDAAAASQVAAESAGLHAWLARGTVPGTGTPYAATVREALLDLRALTTPQGAATAGRAAAWRYVWPRDASFVAAALARTGHRGDAAAVLAYLQRLPTEPQGFQARYLPDGSGRVPDARGVEVDGVGWVLWAVDQVADAEPNPTARAALVASLQPLVQRCAAVARRLTDDGRRLPPPSRDYWEVPERTETLGTSAALLAGLRAAARLARPLDQVPDARADQPTADQPTADQARTDDAAADQARADDAAADRLAALIRARFGPRYGRHPGDHGRDAAVAFLLPPFAPASSTPPDPAVLAAWSGVQAGARRPAGGLAPGEDWPDDGISWTPETALFALTAAATGDRATAERWLGWLSAHRTAGGAVPEKVLADGSPAAVAPLAWTDAEIVLTAWLLDAGRSAGPSPSRSDWPSPGDTPRSSP